MAGKDVMNINIHQHEAFQPQLDAFNAYCANTKADDFDSLELRRLMDELAPVLLKHLAEEIPTLIALKPYGQKVQDAHDKFEVEVRKDLDMVSFILLCIPTG